MRIAVGCDHVGFPLKGSLVEALEEDEHAVLDLGAHGTEPVDYPALAKAVATAIGNGFVDLGVLMCESGIGGSIAANKFMGIRAAACDDAETARHSRVHENVNLLCINAAHVDAEAAVAVVREWLSVEFSGADHDVRIIARISEIEAGTRHGPHHDHPGDRGSKPPARPAAPRSAPPATPTPTRAAAPAAAAEIALEMEAPEALEVSAVQAFIASLKDDNVRAMATRLLESVRGRYPSAAGVSSGDGFSFSVNGAHAASVTIGKGFVQLEVGPDRIPTSRIRDVEGLEAALSLPSIVRALEAVKS